KAFGLGAMHSMELSNDFVDMSASRASLLLRLGSSEDMESLTALMQKHCANFIHLGRPGADWPEYITSASHAKFDMADHAPAHRATMSFEVPHHGDYDPRRKRRKAWNDYNRMGWGLGRPDILAEIEFLLEGFGP